MEAKMKFTKKKSKVYKSILGTINNILKEKKIEICRYLYSQNYYPRNSLKADTKLFQKYFFGKICI